MLHQRGRIGNGRAACVAGIMLIAGLATASYAQQDPRLPSIPTRDVELSIDSGELVPTGRVYAGEVVYSTTVRLQDAAWLRLWFDACELSGDAAADGAFVRVTSTLDGAVQTLNAEQLGWWSNSSAYFNGPEVVVEVVSRGGRGAERLRIRAVTAGLTPAPSYSGRSICGPTDDRVLSNELPNARVLPSGCTGWLFDDANRTFLSAGHCGISSASVIQFQVPLSTSSGGLVNPPPEHQYPVEPLSIQVADLGLGNDWAYFACFPNTQTGMTAFQSQGSRYYELSSVIPPIAGQTIRITGYGTTSAPVSSTWNQVQKTHTGAYMSVSGTIVRYRPDTTGGNSGSPVYEMSSKKIIAIHTNAGCNAGDANSANQGCSILQPGLQTALGAPRGLCRSGLASPAGNLFVSADLNNNVGMLNETSGAFARVNRAGPNAQGLAFDWIFQSVYAVDAAGNVSVIDSVSGVETALGTITGATGPLNGLAYNPWVRVLYTVAQASGQLYSVDPVSLVATPIGAAMGRTIGALDFDPVARVLYGLDDAAGGTRLVVINTVDAVVEVRGVLGSGITDCNGLAAGNGRLYSINAGTEQLLSISPVTGAATVIGPTNGLFGSGYGMAIRLPAPTCTRADYNQDGGADTSDILDLASDIASGAQSYPPNSPDFNQDGGADTSDILDLAEVVAAGC